MSPEEKLVQVIRDGLILKHGEEFLRLSEKDQAELILRVMREYVDNIKKEV